MSNLTFQNYSEFTKTTAQFPPEAGLTYLTLGLTGEAGEVAEKVKKIIRDKDGDMTLKDREEILKELGDVLWYTSELSTLIAGSDKGLDTAARGNIRKLKDRLSRDMIKGNGDNR